MSSPIRNAFLPHFLYIPLLQHIGSPAEAVVSPGDIVSRGDVIGKASGYVSVDIHTPLPGRVVAIEDHVTATADKVPTVVIEVEGAFSLKGQRQENQQGWKSLSRDEILKRMKEKGLVGLGGATFPMHVKYAVPPGKKVTTLIVNAVECEPFLSADNRLVLEQADDLVTGIDIAMKTLGVDRTIVGFEADMPEAAKELQDRVKARRDIEVMIFAVKYPQGAEKQLIKAATGLEVPSGGLPMDVGVVVSNAGSLIALKEAIVDDKPLFE
ncbi:MAG TPA: RnfABCDGE type electron transport complex subunit C, partial [Spirochaetota bacterium]|nr:RnfABCDGE type electron transport complex subunit C [Spirochaetota bacterium]